MAASDYVPIFFKNRLHLAGRPQMGSRPGILWFGVPRQRTGGDRGWRFGIDEISF
jgi:hypothetical protein